jgi:GNAT superfamily N-acetyltransferase
MNLRPATSADLPALVDLLCVLFTQEAEFEPDRAAQARGLAAILDVPAVGAILVAEETDVLLGMVSLLWTVSTALGARAGLLEDRVGAPAARGRGVGGRLLEAAIAHARAAGCRRLTLLTDADNAGAQRFYRRRGFVASPMLPFRLALD